MDQGFFAGVAAILPPWGMAFLFLVMAIGSFCLWRRKHSTFFLGQAMAYTGFFLTYVWMMTPYATAIQVRALIRLMLVVLLAPSFLDTLEMWVSESRGGALWKRLRR